MNDFNVYDGTLVSCSIAEKDVVVPQGIRKIADYAFYRENLETVVLPSSLVSIGAYAFGECTSLRTVTMPGGVKEIGAHAFEGCGALTGISVPSSARIGEKCFDGCPALIVPAPLEAPPVREDKPKLPSPPNPVIREKKFSGPLTARYNEPDEYEDLEDESDGAEMKRFGWYSYDYGSNTIFIDPGTETIEEEAFFLSDLTIKKVIVPTTVKWIKANAFAFTELSEVFFMGGINSLDIDPDAFIGTEYEDSEEFQAYLATRGFMDPDADYPYQLPPVADTDPCCQYVDGAVMAEGRYKKQTGNEGRFAYVKISFRPQSKSLGPAVINCLPVDNFVNKYLEDIKKGITAACYNGINGKPVFGVEARIIDADYHPVDSHREDFFIAARIAFESACADMQCVDADYKTLKGKLRKP